MQHRSSRTAPPPVLQGNFLGRAPAFVQAHTGPFAAHAPASHVQAALQQHAAPCAPRVAQPVQKGNAFQVPASVNLASAGPGQPLPAAVQQKMESFFGADFSDVRVHVGQQAPAIGALAFTMGANLYFAPGQYNPHSAHGQRLLGHELAHVVQQRAGRVRNPFGSGTAVVQDPALEAEAERMGVRAVQAMLPAAPVVSPAAPAAGTGPAARAVQPMRLANSNPTWQDTTKYVKRNAGHFGNVQDKNFGTGNEPAFRCPGCRRWIPVVLGTVDHIVPKSVLKTHFDLTGKNAPEFYKDIWRDSYGLSTNLDYKKISYRKKQQKQNKWIWQAIKIRDAWKHEDFVNKHLANDLDNLQLMCHSCNSSKRDRDNPNGSGVPPNPVGATQQETVKDHLANDVDIDVAPGVNPDASYPASQFAAAWTATRAYFLGKKYHTAVTTRNFGAGVEPSYTCPGCTRQLPIAIATVDHVLPKNQYWWRSLDQSNLQLMCNICNSSKGG